MSARRFFESDEAYNEYCLAEKAAGLWWIDVLGRENYTKAAEQLEAELYDAGYFKKE